MALNKRDRSPKANPRSIDPDTGDLYDPSEPTTPKKSKVLDALKDAARDAIVRRTSTKP
jgi:hypothetical protein